MAGGRFVCHIYGDMSHNREQLYKEGDTPLATECPHILCKSPLPDYVANETSPCRIVAYILLFHLLGQERCSRLR